MKNIVGDITQKFHHKEHRDRDEAKRIGLNEGVDEFVFCQDQFELIRFQGQSTVEEDDWDCNKLLEN